MLLAKPIPERALLAKASLRSLPDDLVLNYFKLIIETTSDRSLDYGVLKQDTVTLLLRYFFPADLCRLIPHIKVG